MATRRLAEDAKAKPPAFLQVLLVTLFTLVEYSDNWFGTGRLKEGGEKDVVDGGQVAKPLFLRSLAALTEGKH